MSRTSPSGTRRLGRFSCALLLLVAFALLCLMRFHDVHGQDEISHYMKLSRQLYANGFSQPNSLATFSPHLYPLLACGVSQLFGSINSFTLRFTGLLSWLVTLTVMAWLTRRARPCLTLLAVVTLPCAIAAVNIIDIDQAVLPLFTLLLVWSVHAWLEQPAPETGKPLGSHGLSCAVMAAYALALWCRLSTPLILAPLFLAYAYLRTRRVQSVLMLALLLFGGLLLFGFTWVGYCHATGIRFDGPFNYLAASFGDTTTGARGATLGKLANNVLCVVLWGLNPYAILLAGLAVWQLLRDWWHSGRQRFQDCLFLLSGCYLLLAYAVVGGALFGFPKYQMPGFPLLIVGLVRFSLHHWQRQNLQLKLWRLLAFAGVVLVVGFLAKDQLLTLRLDLRVAMVSGDTIVKPLSTLISHVAFAHVAILVAMAGLRHLRLLPLVPMLVAAAVTVNAALLVYQTTGGYNTTYLYGDRGDTRSVAAFVNDHHLNPEKSLLPVEVLHELPRLDLAHRPAFVLDDPGALLGRLLREQPEAIAISPLTFPAKTVCAFRSDVLLMSYLQSKYRCTVIGHYWLWHKDNAGTSSLE